MVARTGQFNNNQEQVTHPKINDDNFSLCVGNDGSSCRKSLPSKWEFLLYAMMVYSLPEQIETKSEKATLKVGIDLDGTIVHIDGTIEPSTISNAKTRNGISLDFKTNARFDNVSII